MHVGALWHVSLHVLPFWDRCSSGRQRRQEKEAPTKAQLRVHSRILPPPTAIFLLFFLPSIARLGTFLFPSLTPPPTPPTCVSCHGSLASPNRSRKHGGCWAHGGRGGKRGGWYSRRPVSCGVVYQPRDQLAAETSATQTRATWHSTSSHIASLAAVWLQSGCMRWAEWGGGRKEGWRKERSGEAGHLTFLAPSLSRKKSEAGGRTGRGRRPTANR